MTEALERQEIHEKIEGPVYSLNNKHRFMLCADVAKEMRPLLADCPDPIVEAYDRVVRFAELAAHGTYLPKAAAWYSDLLIRYSMRDNVPDVAAAVTGAVGRIGELGIVAVAEDDFNGSNRLRPVCVLLLSAHRRMTDFPAPHIAWQRQRVAEYVDGNVPMPPKPNLADLKPLVLHADQDVRMEAIGAIRITQRDA